MTARASERSLGDFERRVLSECRQLRQPAPSASEFIADHIREMVHFGKLRPGDPVREMVLAKQFEVSRGPVRIALRLLETEGLLEHEPNRGTYVRRISPEEVRALFEIRAVVAGVTARRAAESCIPDSALADLLREGVALMEAIADAGADAAQFIRVRRSTSAVLAEMGDSRYLLRLARENELAVAHHWMTVNGRGRQAQAVDGWRPLVDAVLKRRPQRAARAAISLIENASKRLLDQ